MKTDRRVFNLKVRIYAMLNATFGTTKEFTESIESLIPTSALNQKTYPSANS